ncbi:MAG: S41 family peptidase, partial [Nitrospinota bacterium]
MRGHPFRHPLLALFLLLGVVASCASSPGRPLSARAEAPRRQALTEEEEAALRLLREVVSLVEENYVTYPDLKLLYWGALEGLRQKVGARRVELSGGPRQVTLSIGQASLSLRVGRGPERDFAAFGRAFAFVRQRAAPPMAPRLLAYAAIRGMLSKLDSHTNFLPPEVFRELQVETTGRFGGLGIEIAIRNGKLIVVAPIENTPAYRAGIRAGDHIVAVDGHPTEGMSLFEVVKRMRGRPGTRVVLAIQRAGFDRPREFPIVRAIIRVRSVKVRRLKGGVGYVRVRIFHQETVEELERALSQLEGERVRGVILDLRNNPGGLLRQAVEVSDKFLEGGALIVFTRGR